MHYLITGGAGFIGSNLAHALLSDGHEVTIFDNLSRPGSSHNVDWLRSSFGRDFRLVCGDIRDAAALSAALRDAEVVAHLAAQVAVTSSVSDPRHDFEVNALGTFNLLEAARIAPKNPIVLYASTNKVYGSMEHAAIIEDETRYRFRDHDAIPETHPLDFHSPYGCSKGAAEQYVRDFSRIYGVRTVAFRQSCIYGPRQFGIEDQGWLAHFVIAAQLHRPITIYGDGKQVRDLLHVDDLIGVYKRAVASVDIAQGKIYNVGGGPANALSIWAEVGPLLERLAQYPIAARYAQRRPGDQAVCVLDTSKAERELGWRPTIGAREGIEGLWAWVGDNKPLFATRE